MPKSATTGVPEMSLPIAILSLDLAPSNSSDTNKSRSETISRSWFGISKPITDLPSIISTTRTLVTDKPRAKSFAKPVIRLPFTPAARRNSKRVITGPGKTASTSTEIPKSFRTSSTRLESSSNSALE